MAAISLAHISKSYGSTSVLNDISLEIAQGEMFFLLGPSGCGKTTLLRIIAGLDSADAGTVSFDGTDISSEPPRARNVSMMFQSYSLWPHMTVAQNISFGLEMRKVSSTERAERLSRALEACRLTELRDRYPHQLSGGQQQRVALGRALAHDPAVILLDEPLSNLDTKLRAELREEIAKIHRAFKMTMVYVTHDQGEALSMADRIAILNRGRLHQVDTPQTLYNRPADTFVAGFMGDANLITGQLSGSAVTTPLGSFSVKSGVAPAGHGQVTIGIRPEHIVVDAPPGANTVSGTISQISYLGATSRVTLTTPSAFNLIVTATGGTRFSVGETRTVALPSDSLMVLNE